MLKNLQAFKLVQIPPPLFKKLGQVLLLEVNFRWMFLGGVYGVFHTGFICCICVQINYFGIMLQGMKTKKPLFSGLKRVL